MFGEEAGRPHTGGVLPKTGHCFFQDVPLLTGNFQLALQVFDPVFLFGSARDATPRSHGASLSSPNFLMLSPANDIVAGDAKLAGHLGTTLARTLNQPYGLLLELGGGMLLGGGQGCLQSDSA